MSLIISFQLALVCIADICIFAELLPSWPSFEALLLRSRHLKSLLYQLYLPWRLAAASN